MSLQQKKDEFIQLIEANKGIIYKVSRAYCRHPEDRKDLVQEIIMQIWKSFDRYNDQFRISTWIYRIALNVAISFYRKSKLRQYNNITLTDEDLRFIADNQTDDIEDEISLLYNFIYELKEMDRALILLYLEEKSYDEMAEILDISKTNVATKISRIKSILKDKFLTHKTEL